ncbi:MAG: carbamoyltransferase HypF [Nocardioides sp.]
MTQPPPHRTNPTSHSFQRNARYESVMCSASRVRRRVVVRGVVQGVGFRPHVYALARSLDLAGSVWNSGQGVVAEVEGDPGDVEAFTGRIGDDAPPLALVVSVEAEDLPVVGGTGFTIGASDRTVGRTFVSPDTTICEDCLTDLRDPGNRRFRHPFVTCTNCGPRYTITTGLPYDRPTTTMSGFAMCGACAAEYADPADRRFHAQTVCCPDCGPTLRLVAPGRATSSGEDALAEARSLLRDGAVVAVKGIGGYHLACDATDEAAVTMLRKRKQRGDKPFAVMVASLDDALRLVEAGPADVGLLTARARPIVLVPRRPGSVSGAVAPGQTDLGVMLAYAPLHHLLLEPPGPVALVMTSGNLAGEPIVTDDDDAVTRLAGLADAWLTHDRPIHVPCDDSVTRAVGGHEAPVRRSRGQAPLPVTLPFDVPAALAVGGDVTNTFCLAEGRLAWMSGHVGDMDDLATQAAFGAAVEHLAMLTGVEPRAVAADRHPAYRSRTWARDRFPDVVEVQHHHAHVASTMVEHGLGSDRRVIGVAFDGTGFGDDGASWGGEFLVADYGGYERSAHLAYVDLPGGDAGVRNPCRMALSHLRSAGVEWSADLAPVRACDDTELGLLGRQLETGLRCVPTSSMGRLFDAVSSLLGICHRAGYDAQAAMELEAVARPWGAAATGYAFGEHGDAAPVVAAVVDDVRRGVAPGLAAARFQQAVVDLVVATVLRLREETGIRTATLSGGVFLNAFLTAACAAALEAAGVEALTHHVVPASDAGLALGQLAVLAHRGNRSTELSTEQETTCA